MTGLSQVVGGEVQSLSLHSVLGGNGHGVVALVIGDGEPLHPSQGAGVLGVQVGEEQLVDGGGVLTHTGEGLTVPHGLHGAVAVPADVLIALRQDHGGADAHEAAAAGAGLGGVHGEVQSDSTGAVHGVDHGLRQAVHVGEGLGEGDGGEAIGLDDLDVTGDLGVLASILPGPVEVAVVVVDRSAPEVGDRALGQQGLAVVLIVGDGAAGLVDVEGEALTGDGDDVLSGVVHHHFVGGGSQGHLLYVGRYLKLLMGNLVASSGPQGVALELHGDVQVVLSAVLGLLGHGLSIGDGDGLSGLGTHIGVDGALADDGAVLHQLPHHVVLVEVGEAVLVLDLHQAAHQIGLRGGEPQALILVLHFLQLGLSHTVGSDQTVLAEVAGVVAPVAGVAAVAEELAVQGVTVDFLVVVGIILSIVVVGAVFLLLDAAHLSPQQDALVVLADGRSGGVLGTDLVLGQSHVVEAAHGDLTGELTAAVIALVAQAQQSAGGGDGGGAGLGADLLAVQVHLHGAVVIGGNQLVPVVQKVVAQLGLLHHQGVPAAVVDEELQVVVAVELQSELLVALGGEDLVGLELGGLENDFHGEGLAVAGQSGVVGPVGVLKAHIAVDQAGVGQSALTGLLVDALGAGHAAGIVGQLIAGGIGDHTGLVHPVPDEAAQHVVAGTDGIPVLLDAAHGVAHGVVVLAHHVGHVVAGLTLDGGHGGIHVGAHVGAVGLVGALGVHRTGGIVVLEVPDQIIEHVVGIVGVALVVVLVAGGPGHDGADVLQTMEGGDRAVHSQLLEEHLLALVVHQLVRLQVGLGHHVQTVLVAQIVQIVVVGVVRGTDGVEVVLLHQLNVLLHDLLAHGLAVHGVGVVAVGAAEHQRLTVDGDGLVLAVLRGAVAAPIHLSAGELDLTEAQLLGHGAQVGAAVLVEAHHQVVQVGVLRAPQLRVLHVLGQVHGLAGARINGGHLGGHAVDEHGAVLVVHTHVHLVAGSGLGGLVLHGNAQVQVGVLIGLVQVGGDEVVVEVHLRGAVDVHVTEDAAVLEHVLQLEPSAVAELMYFHSQQVLAVHQVVGDVEAVGGVGVLAVTHGLAVEVHIVGSLHALEVQVDAAIHLFQSGQALIQGKGLAVHTHGVVVDRGQRSGVAAGVVLLPGHLGIGVDGIVQTPIGPAGGQLEPAAPGVIGGVVGLVEVGVALLGDGVVLHHAQGPVGIVLTGEVLHVAGGLLVEVDGAVQSGIHAVVDDAGGGEHAGLLPVDCKHVLVAVLTGPLLISKGGRGDGVFLLQHGGGGGGVPGILVPSLGVPRLGCHGMKGNHTQQHAQGQTSGYHSFVAISHGCFPSFLFIV